LEKLWQLFLTQAVMLFTTMSSTTFNGLNSDNHLSTLLVELSQILRLNTGIKLMMVLCWPSQSSMTLTKMSTTLSSLLSGTLFPNTLTVLVEMEESMPTNNVMMETKTPTLFLTVAEPTANFQSVETELRTELNNAIVVQPTTIPLLLPVPLMPKRPAELHVSLHTVEMVSKMLVRNVMTETFSQETVALLFVKTNVVTEELMEVKIVTQEMPETQQEPRMVADLVVCSPTVVME
jgi:hypothetical protein